MILHTVTPGLYLQAIKSSTISCKSACLW